MLDERSDIFRDIVFSDESRFNIYNSDGRLLVRRRPEAFHPDCIQYKNQMLNQVGIMVWGCISASGLGPLVLVHGNENSQQYAEIISFNLENWYPRLFDADDSLYFV